VYLKIRVSLAELKAKTSSVSSFSGERLNFTEFNEESVSIVSGCSGEDIAREGSMVSVLALLVSREKN
jgi:hypothetical protein